MKNRTEMKEMELNQVTGGYAISDLLYKNHQKITIESAIMDSRKRANIILLGRQSKLVTRATSAVTGAATC